MTEHEEHTSMKQEIDTLNLVIFGNPRTGEKGMKEKVDEIHEILTKSRGVLDFFGGVRGILSFIIVIGAAFALIKGWLLK